MTLAGVTRIGNGVETNAEGHWLGKVCGRYGVAMIPGSWKGGGINNAADVPQGHGPLDYRSRANRKKRCFTVQMDLTDICDRCL